MKLHSRTPLCMYGLFSLFCHLESISSESHSHTPTPRIASFVAQLLRTRTAGTYGSTRSRVGMIMMHKYVNTQHLTRHLSFVCFAPTTFVHPPRANKHRLRVLLCVCQDTLDNICHCCCVDFVYFYMNNSAVVLRLCWLLCILTCAEGSW